jgi:hypothetical protein
MAQLDAGSGGFHFARFVDRCLQMDAWAATASSEWRRGADIVTMLIGIYGTKELFVNEYRQLLATRLLTLANIDVCYFFCQNFY